MPPAPTIPIPIPPPNLAFEMVVEEALPYANGMAQSPYPPTMDPRAYTLVTTSWEKVGLSGTIALPHILHSFQ